MVLNYKIPSTAVAQRKDWESKLWVDIYSVDGSKKCRGDDMLVIWNYWPGTIDICYGETVDRNTKRNSKVSKKYY